MSKFRRRRRAVVCQQLVEMVTDYLEGDLDPAGRDAVQAHLRGCPDCAGYVQQVRRMLELTAGLARIGDVPTELVESLSARYRERH